MNAINMRPFSPSFSPDATISQAPAVGLVRAEPRRAVPAAGPSFSDCMEAALTGVVLLSATLFGAGLLRYAAPACAARTFGVDALYMLAGAIGVFTLSAIIQGIAVLVAAERHRDELGGKI